ncbi:TolC family protein [Winogradskyella sediminis]|uniref:Outer membrane efflux protein n=1 Tax=Winogradskyella sediminis TaxID=1382466 RepID=A0A1H1QLF6_9FLAO|nr:TolC family protein [Winogradskyella sediminis]REG89755.1 outer membrane efflux protein [Winogradskyella sediminis]SDS24290.1 Outer membrane efflux protein [Winogradskyella sediminis]
MTQTIKIILTSVLFVFASSCLLAQDSIASTIEEESLKLMVPKLEVLMDSALVNNGMLAYRKDEIEVKKANLKAKRRNWTRNFGIQADTRYGNYNNFSNSVSEAETVTLTSATTQTTYAVGLYLKIPVFDIFNRKSEMKQAKFEISQAENFVKFQEYEIREKVIRYYEDLLLKENILKIQAINLSDARVNMEMAKKEFTNGQIEMYEYIRISDITAGVATEFEKAKSNLLLAKKLLENYTGIKIN